MRAIYQGSVIFNAPRYALLSLGLIWIVYVIHIFFTDNISTLLETPLIRSPIFVFTSLVNIFLIPQRVPVEDFFNILIFLTIITTLVGLLSYVSPYTLLGVVVEPYYGGHNLLPVRKLKSVFGGPNAFGRFILGGFVASLFMTLYSNRWYFVSSIITILGISLAYSRMTVATAVVGFTLCITYFIAPRRWFQAISASVLPGVVVLFAMIINVIPGPEFISGIDSSGRNVLWRGAIEAWRQRPILGLGPGSNSDQLAPFIIGTGQAGHVHNSYLRMLMSTGIVGFAAYAYFHIRTIWTGLRLVDNPATAAVIVLIVAYSINQITNIFSMFGFTVTSVILSLSFGYVLRDIVGVSVFQSEKNS